MGAHFLCIKDMAGLCKPYAAKMLVEEAGYSKEKPLKTTFIIAQGGTG